MPDDELHADPPVPPPAADPPAASEAGEPEDPAAGITGKDEQIAALRNAITASRAKLREAKADRERLEAAERENAELKPYAEFLKQNPQLLQPAPPPPAPPQPGQPQDPAAAQLAQRFSLYTGDGQLDVATARAIINDQQALAQHAAQSAVAPVAQQVWQAQATANLDRVLSQRDSAGQPLVTPDDMRKTIEQTFAGMHPQRAIQMLANPNIVEVIVNNALGGKARAKAGQPPPPSEDPLYRESAGGGVGAAMDESERRFYRKVGIDDKTATAAAAKFDPTGPNEME